MIISLFPVNYSEKLGKFRQILITCSNCFKAPILTFHFDEIIGTSFVSVLHKLSYANSVKCLYRRICRQQTLFYQYNDITEIENMSNKEIANICDYFDHFKLRAHLVRKKLNAFFSAGEKLTSVCHNVL